MTQPKWLELAWRDVGVAEKKGVLNNPTVMRYYRDVGADWVKGDDVAWCAAFLGSCLARAGFGSTRSLMARSYLKWGRKLAKPRQGAIAVFSRGSNKALGHVGFYVGEKGRSIIVLGGNQNDSVNISSYSKSRLIGYRWPSAGDTTGDAEGNRQFERALEHVLEFEGGWTNDPQDPGGPTNKGITLQVYAENKGVRLTARNRSGLMGELRRIPDELVRDIYFRRYWRKARCPDIPAAIAFIHFDAAVNHGPARAARMLQQAVGADVDGEVGPMTIEAARAGDASIIVKSYGKIRDRFYRSLSHFPRFGRGWLRRLRWCVKRALELVQANFNEDQEPVQPDLNQSQPVQPEPVQPEPIKPEMYQPEPKKPEMYQPEPNRPDNIEQEKDQRNMTNEPKWWGQSMTIWGAIVTALSAVLPVVGPLLGYDISVDMVAQFGEQIARIIQATGGVVGTIMTIFGRLRTVQPLQRRRMSFDF